MNEIMEIRKIIEEDFTHIRVIASKMWEGNDYLPGVFDEWLADGGFYALTVDDTVVGVTKITLLPCNVIWLEGLRMDPDYQGRGLGEKLAQFAFEKAVGLVNADKANHIEFSTYYKNHASLHIAKKAGFEVIERFFILSGEFRGSGEIEKAILTENDFRQSDRHITAGWKIIARCSESTRWLNRKCNVYSAGGSKFYIRKNDTVINLTDYSKEGLIESVDSITRKLNGQYDIVIPDYREESISDIKNLGFEFWEKPEGPNMFLLRLVN